MADIMFALCQKRSTLVARRRQIRQEADRQIKEIDGEIAEIDRAASILNDAVKGYLCKRCGGTGNDRRCDAAGQMEDYPCPSCKGTGVARPEVSK